MFYRHVLQFYLTIIRRTAVVSIFLDIETHHAYTIRNIKMHSRLFMALMVLLATIQLTLSYEKQWKKHILISLQKQWKKHLVISLHHLQVHNGTFNSFKIIFKS